MVVGGAVRGFAPGRFVEVLPRLAVVAIETVMARFRAGRVKGGYGVAVGGGAVAVMFGTSVPEEEDENWRNLVDFKCFFSSWGGKKQRLIKKLRTFNVYNPTFYTIFMQTKTVFPCPTLTNPYIASLDCSADQQKKK